MSGNPTPKPTVLYLKPGQRKRPGTAKPVKPSPQWQPHQSSYAIDPWGTALRTLKEQGVDFNL